MMVLDFYKEILSAFQNEINIVPSVLNIGGLSILEGKDQRKVFE